MIAANASQETAIANYTGKIAELKHQIRSIKMQHLHIIVPFGFFITLFFSNEKNFSCYLSTFFKSRLSFIRRGRPWCIRSLVSR